MSTDPEDRCIAAEHISGPLIGFRQVMSPRWASRYMEPIQRLLLANDAVTLEKTVGSLTATVRYTFTDDEPNLD